jgi:cytidine deaminase
MKLEDLIAEAKHVRLNARAEQSGFKVGAALETRSGKVFCGCNVENSTLGLTVCAERVAIWKALSEGESEFQHLVIAADSSQLTPPCGACRQIIWEYCGDIEIILVNLTGKTASYKMSSLLPLPFDGRFIGK